MIAQDPPAISLTVEAGYGSLFREGKWFPLYIRASNEGGNVVGRLVVRPETSGSGFSNTFSTPIDLATGARKAVFLYITARSFASEVRVEFIDQSGVVVASEIVPLRGVLDQDQLHVAVTQSSTGAVDLSGARVGGFNAFQGVWQVENIPDRAPALDAIDILLFSDVDTGTLTTAQRQAITDWVVQGGHLIVTGGTNWQATAAGLTDLLPLIPDSSDTVSDLASLAALANSDPAELDADTVTATGALLENTEVLAADDQDIPLYVRRSFGMGTVDYLTVDPIAEPLRSWGGLGDLWFTVASSVNPRPTWTNGFTNPDRAVGATEILPGFNLLPNVLPLCGFLALYVALIGPLNYIVLDRINRREFAWVTIPLFILVFSGLAWVVGFNLRGNIVTLSRLAVVQSWPESDRAQVNGLVGLLSPRRSTYTLEMEDGGLLRPITRTIQTNPFAGNIQSTTDIQQSTLFRADNFSVDASFIATFSTTSVIERPAISGQASLSPGTEPGLQVVRGSVRNDSAVTLVNPVILARGVTLRLLEPLAPGDVETFDFVIASESEPAAPSPLERSAGVPSVRFSLQRSSSDPRANEQSVIDIIGDDLYDYRAYTSAPSADAEAQLNRRHQLFVSSFTRDAFSSTARGDGVFLVGWSDEMPLLTTLANTTWEAIDTTLHIIELAVERRASNGRTRISSSQFTWTAQTRAGLTTDLSPINSILQSGDEAVFRFTPIEGAVLTDVDTLRVIVDNNSGARADTPLELWDWQARAWTLIDPDQRNDTTAYDVFTLRDPARYLGPRNAVQVRVAASEGSNTFVRIDSITIEHEGRY
jgi:hypothetical protein